MQCHVCGADHLRLVEGFPELGRVASDCRPWPAGGGLAICPRCGAVQKVLDDAWRRDARDIYGSYSIYHQAPDGAEQPVFDRTSGQPTPRSQQVLKAAMAGRPIKAAGRMIDIGCGNGAMLRAFAALHSGWQVYGFEPNIRDEAALLRIPGMQKVYTGDIADVPGRYDLVTIAHALEHIEDPLPALRRMRALVADNGLFLIQVPYYRANPFDLVIADHCTHYTKALIARLLRASGFEPLLLSSDIVEKELTVLAAPVSVGEADEAWYDGGDAAQTAAAERELAALVAWLAKLRADADACAQDGQFGIFGTAIAGNWLFGQMRDKIDFFVDEDMTRVGQSYYGKPVKAPAELDAGAHIYMPLPRALAASIAARLKARGVRANFHVPPQMPAELAQDELVNI